MRGVAIAAGSLAAHVAVLLALPRGEVLDGVEVARVAGVVEEPEPVAIELVEIVPVPVPVPVPLPDPVPSPVPGERPAAAAAAAAGTGAAAATATGTGTGTETGTGRGTGTGTDLMSMRSDGERNGVDLALRPSSAVVAGLLARPAGGDATAPESPRSRDAEPHVRLHVPAPRDLPRAVADHLESWYRDPVGVSKNAGEQPFDIYADEALSAGIASAGKQDGIVYTIVSGRFGAGARKKPKQKPPPPPPEDAGPLMLANLDRLRGLDPAEQRELVVELWRECDAGEAGDNARAALYRWVRVHLPDGSERGFSAEELAAVPGFRPYD